MPENAQAPLYVFVHGRAGNSSVLTPFASLPSPQATLLFPQAWLTDRRGGFSWWTIPEEADTQHSRIGPELETSVSKLEGFITRALMLYQLNPSSITLIGFSQGAALSSVLIQRYPERYNAAALLAGFVIPIESNAEPNVTKGRVLIAHGEQDDVVPLDRARQGATTLEQQGYTVEFVSDPVGHKIGTQGMRALKKFLC